MNGILYLVAVILIIGWILGFFVYSAGSIIHLMLVLGIISIVLNVLKERSV
ncbi:lmo0937 family membrane protein [Solitalea lacus]|uniref:lmo0937 family membrane protein n=1 Tax=Solitalea lacus TaxID=2911172 RepID=UPI001EDBD33C|nr:lmo0937 family membrane protein [Solitalea lacus]UKJ06972.1 lmo0937 family membrane protein [Solitalea lacus]